MKNIIIAGVAKSGKSTVSELIEKDKYNYIPLDIFVSSFKHNLKDSKITSNVIIDDESSKKLGKWLSKAFEFLPKCSSNPYLIDSAHIYPKDVIENINRDEWDIYFFGYPNYSELFISIRCNIFP